MKILRFKGTEQEWTIPLLELSKELRLNLQLRSIEFIKLLNEIDDSEFLNSIASVNVRKLERIFNAPDAR